ncbi:MAG: hypothetical protein DMG21_00045 [Acidobacteria bacterium]|nr:MAG: hypothetical protein DMG21_00045 [Acidobacteriota bacterium]
MSLPNSVPANQATPQSNRKYPRTLFWLESVMATDPRQSRAIHKDKFMALRDLIWPEDFYLFYKNYFFDAIGPIS